MIELCQPPVDKPQVLELMVDHNFVWFDIPVHDSHAVAVVQRFQQIETDDEVWESLVELLSDDSLYIDKSTYLSKNRHIERDETNRLVGGREGLFQKRTIQWMLLFARLKRALKINKSFLWIGQFLNCPIPCTSYHNLRLINWPDLWVDRNHVELWPSVPGTPHRMWPVE